MKIDLVGGKGEALVDSDYAWLSRYHWYNVKGYARGVVCYKPKKVWRYMHQLVMGRLQVGEEIDHVNGDKLDNRRCNLRIVNRYQQMQNCNWQKRNRSGFVGVFWDAQRGKWRAEMMRERKRFMKRFDRREDAESWWTANSKRLVN